MSQPAPRVGQCPNCGDTVEFKLGASLAAVCRSCQAVVARKGIDFAAIGKVGDLIPTGSKIALGMKGHLEKVEFEVLGRLQYQWNQGVWDEWYLGFADGRWGWLAEAQGRFYLTFKAPPRAVPQRGVTAGSAVFLEGLGRFVCTDVKQAHIVGVQGELPDPVKLGEAPLTADLEGDRGSFATIDYGVAGERPVIFVGRQVELAALNLGGLPSAAPTRGPRPTADKLVCPNCAAPLTVRLPDLSVRVTCQSCHQLLSVDQGAFQVIGAVGRGQAEPAIPIGAKGTLRGLELMVVGFMVRSCHVDHTRYPWREYLLFQPKTQGFLWLVESDGHWQLAQPISASAVHVGSDAEYQGRRFRHFSSVEGAVELVLGEFYWAVAQGERAELDDYIAPPVGLSCERTRDEVSWSRLDHLEVSEVAQAFSRPTLTRLAQAGVGALQPWPWEAAWSSMLHWMVAGVCGLVAILAVLVLRPTNIYLDRTIGPQELTTPEPFEPGGESPPSDVRSHSFLSEPFDIAPGDALELHFRADVVQSWAYAGGAVIHDESSVSAPFGLEVSSYSGYEDGEAWSEGSSSASASFAAPGSGRAVLRADLQWDPKSAPPTMHLQLRSESFSGWQFGFCLLGLLWPILIGMQRAGFERARWEGSNVAPPASGGSDDE